MNPPAHSPRGSLHRSRLLALPLVALCAVAYVGSVAHFALVQHATCLEHGEVIHAGEAEAHSGQSAAVGVSFTDQRVTRSGQTAMASHDAEAHCAHSSLRREGLVPPAGLLRAAEPPDTPGPVFALEQDRLEPIARLRLAPKSSPPLA